MNYALEPTKVEKMRGLPWSVAFSTTTSIFGQLSFFGSMWVLFLNHVGLNKTSIGVLLSFIYFADVIALFLAPTIARYGNKRTFLLFWSVRYIFVGLLFFIPYTLNNWGIHGVLILITVVMLSFSLCRSIGLTALFPWQHEYIPGEIRGKYIAVDNISTNLGNILSIIVISYVIGSTPGINRFLWLIAAGLVFGVLSVGMASRIPGGKPHSLLKDNPLTLKQRINPIRNHGLLMYLIGASFILLTNGAINSFVPLYMQDEVGLDPGKVVFLQTGIMVGGLAASFLWGWAADRYGSKPVVLSGITLLAILPVLLFIVPRHTILGIYLALAISLFQGVANMGWTIGSNRLLFVNIVPNAERTEYMAVHNTWIGVITGISQLVGGRMLDFSKDLSGHLWFISIDSYTFLFAAGIVLPVLGSLFLRKIQEDRAITAGEFASMFMRGNPILAVESVIRYQFAKDERSTIEMTERLGNANSPLTVEELLESLKDPRFNVRFEAIISIGRRAPEARLREALIQVLNGSQPALSVAASWALGRMGDKQVIPALRESLSSRYRSVQDHAARALGTLGDQEAIPILLERIKVETDLGLQIAYASALGKLRAKESVGLLLNLLKEQEDEVLRTELSFAIARIIGDEHLFINIMRQVNNNEVGIAISRILASFGKKGHGMQIDEQKEAFITCVNFWATNDIINGCKSMVGLIDMLLENNREEGEGNIEILMILKECSFEINQNCDKRLEYIILALHALGSI